MVRAGWRKPLPPASGELQFETDAMCLYVYMYIHIFDSWPGDQAGRRRTRRRSPGVGWATRRRGNAWPVAGVRRQGKDSGRGGWRPLGGVDGERESSDARRLLHPFPPSPSQESYEGGSDTPSYLEMVGLGKHSVLWK